MKWLLLCEVFLAVECNSPTHFTHDFAIELEGDHMADFLAQKHNFENLGLVLPGIYHFRHRRIARRSVDSFEAEAIRNEPGVKSFEQQTVRRRSKRDYSDVLPEGKNPADPLFEDMWYLDPNFKNRNSPVDVSGGDIRHMNVTAAWSLGFTGRGVSVTILDDGIEWNHPDLAKNYDPDCSFDVNSNDKDPMPHYNRENNGIEFQSSASYYYPNKAIKLTEDVKGYHKEINRHGTRCAGEVAAEMGNGVCVPGIAYNAKIGGIRMLDGDVTDIVEAKSIGFNPDHVDIYSASWGPDDDGRTVDGPAKLAMAAFKKGALSGRRGLGSIFVWASGNGGRYQDHCNCDGYTNSIYTISISSTSEKEEIPWYSEQCASTLASTYSSGSSSEKQIVTTDLRHICTEKHTGTSASAPIAAAIVALALEANSELTWRDMQHLVVQTSKRRKLNAPDWRRNGVDREYSHRYGYGLMDAGLLVEAARDWDSVPEQRNCTTRIVDKASAQRDIVRRDAVEVEFEIDPSCEQFVSRLEHVIVILSLDFDRRGDLKISIFSPLGTESNILEKRPHDYSSKGFDNFEFLTVHMWDEPASVPGKRWKLRIENVGSPDQSGKLRLFHLRLHGTGDNQYESECSAKTFFDETTQKCLKACPRNSYVEHVDRMTDTVVEHRRDVTQEARAAMNKCKPCHASCDRCYGPGKKDCHLAPILSRGKDDITAEDDLVFSDGAFGLHERHLARLSVIVVVSSLLVLALLKLLQKSKRSTHRYTQLRPIAEY